MIGEEAETEALLGQLVGRAGADPASSQLTHLPYSRRSATWPGPGRARPTRTGTSTASPSTSAQPLPVDAIAALVEHFSAGQADGETRTLDFSPWGGAYNRVPAGRPRSSTAATASCSSTR